MTPGCLFDTIVCVFPNCQYPDRHLFAGEGRLKEVEEVLLGFGTALAEDNAEGLSHLLLHLTRYAESGTPLYEEIQTWIEKLQATFKASWEGKELSAVALL